VNRPEDDFPVGHPKRHDYDPASAEALEWMRKNSHPKGERDWPVDHPAALDTAGNTNSREWRAGIDPLNPNREEFSGRTPEQAAAVKAYNAQLAKQAKESPVVPPITAPDPREVTRAVEFLIATGNDRDTAEKIVLRDGAKAVLARAATGQK
jgi:hypothetical protein